MDRCALCLGKRNCVPGNGPVRQGDYLFLGEGPGPDEDKKGIPFCGRTGREVNEGYLPMLGMRRENVRFDNASHCMPESRMDLNDAKDRALAECCAEAHLYPYLEQYKPKLIIAMGAFACHVLDPTIDLELHHGFPRSTPWGKVFVMYHPAGGLHEPKKMLNIRSDWARLRKYLVGKLVLPSDPYIGAEDYAVIQTEDELDADLSGMEDLPLASDTESTRQGIPFCYTYSTRKGRARLIKSTSSKVLSRLQGHLDRWRGPLLWHNWLYDARVVDRMGLRFKPHLIADTMLKAFHLGNLPLGLKSLAYRELGMEMEDFDDLVTPYAKPRILQFYYDAYAEVWEPPEPFLYRNKDGQYKLKKPQSMSKKLKGLLHRLGKDPDTDLFDIWPKWEKDYPGTHDLIESKMGQWPGKCISYAWEDNRERTIRYACRDSDALLRLWPLLQHMQSRVRSTSQENWRD